MNWNFKNQIDNAQKKLLIFLHQSTLFKLPPPVSIIIFTLSFSIVTFSCPQDIKLALPSSIQCVQFQETDHTTDTNDYSFQPIISIFSIT